MKNFIRIYSRGIMRMSRRYSVKLRLWYIRLSWTTIVTHDEAFRCAEVKFAHDNKEDVYPVDISEAEYLYDLDAAILRVYYKYVLPNYKAKKLIGNAQNRRPRCRAFCRGVRGSP